MKITHLNNLIINIKMKWILFVISVALGEVLFVQQGLSNEVDDALDMCNAIYDTANAVCAMIV